MQLVVALGGSLSYCSSSANEDADSRIDKVVFGTIDNSSTTGCATYSDFTNQSTSVVVGQQYSLTITLGSCDGDFSKGVKAYIDWNVDGDFDDANEEVAASGIVKNGDFTANVTVPATATAGNSRLRIVLREKTSDDVSDADALANIKACGAYEWGETEDYGIVIQTSATGVGDELFARSVSVSPNPTNDNTQVTLDNFQMGTVNFTLVDLTGATTFKSWEVNKTTQKLKVPVSLNDLPKGVYLIQVTVNGVQAVKRVVKN